MLNSLVAHSVRQTGNCLRLRLIQMLQHSGTLMGKFQYALHSVTIAFHTKQEPSRVLAGKGGEIDPHIRSIFSEGGVMDTLGQPLPTTSFFPQDHQTQGRVRVLQGQASIAVQSRTTGYPVRKGALGLSDSTIINGFSASLFINLLGVSFLCSAAISNGALETVSKKFLRLAGGRSFVAPIMIYIIGFAVAAIGPGCVPALGIVSALSLPLGKSTGYNAVMLAAIGDIGSYAGRFSPLTPESLLINELASAQGITGFQTPVLIYSTITTIVLSVVAFVYFKGYRVSRSGGVQEEVPPLNGKQILTLVAFLVVIVACAFWGRNVGLIAFAAGIVLILFRAADEQATLKGISWSTLLLVTGMGMLMEIVMEAGGVELLSGGLANVMNSHTAIAIQGLTAGIMSWFSSAIGVVWPTLIPTVSDIAQTVGVSPEGLITIMCLTASFTGLSPASTAGGQVYRARLHQGRGE